MSNGAQTITIENPDPFGHTSTPYRSSKGSRTCSGRRLYRQLLPFLPDHWPISKREVEFKLLRDAEKPLRLLGDAPKPFRPLANEGKPFRFWCEPKFALRPDPTLYGKNHLLRRQDIACSSDLADHDASAAPAQLQCRDPHIVAADRVDIAFPSVYEALVTAHAMMKEIAFAIELRAGRNRDNVEFARPASGTPRLREFVLRSGHVRSDGLVPIAAQAGYRGERHVCAERANDELLALVAGPEDFQIGDGVPPAMARGAGAVASSNPVREIHENV